MVRELLRRQVPIFGICFGNQILGRAFGFGTYKLRYGHRGINQPVADRATGKVEITAHNHGFAVDAPIDRASDTEFGEVRVSHVCLNDNVVEGLRAFDVPAFSVQYHPEAAAGPHDAAYLFDRFAELLQRRQRVRIATSVSECGRSERGADPWIAAKLMPKRSDIQHILVIGSGPIVIGQACEFDYSGTQACRVLRAEGFRVSLVNSNPATIMTDPEFADATYIEPLTVDFVEKVLATEAELGHPVDALLATLGGQTALNLAVGLHASGVLDRYGVELIGADIDAIQRGEDRQKFKEIVRAVGGDVPDSAVCHSLEDAVAFAETVGNRVVIRPSFTMGGLGSGMAHTAAEVRTMVGRGLAASPVHEVLVEESVLGWKEFELELMRDRKDNVVVVCSIENVDPMGVHTGDSITVAPAMTLTDREYQRMRDLGIAVLREVGVDTGGCNIQFAVNPVTGRLIVIEMNPRVSRSSALASKATGFPIAKIAAKLAVGYTLDEVANDITRATPACFEPVLDYVVVKIPRFAFEKFPGADPVLTTHMKSVGEVMAIGRNFTEALGKAMRSLETKAAGFWTVDPASRMSCSRWRNCSARPRWPPTAGSTPSSGRCGPAPRWTRCPRRPASTLVRRPVRPDPGTRRGAGRGRVAYPGAAAPGEAARALRPADRGAASGTVRRGRGAPAAAPRRHPPGLQDRGHLRRRVRREHPVPLLLLRLRDGGAAAAGPAEGADPGQRAEPDRAGHRVRLLLRARGDGAALGAGQRRRRLRDGDDQLQSRRRCPPTTTPPTGCTSSRSPSRTCWRWCTPSSSPATCWA